MSVWPQSYITVKPNLSIKKKKVSIALASQTFICFKLTSTWTSHLPLSLPFSWPWAGQITAVSQDKHSALSFSISSPFLLTACIFSLAIMGAEPKALWAPSFTEICLLVLPMERGFLVSVAPREMPLLGCIQDANFILPLSSNHNLSSACPWLSLAAARSEQRREVFAWAKGQNYCKLTSLKVKFFFSKCYFDSKFSLVVWSINHLGCLLSQVLHYVCRGTHQV